MLGNYRGISYAPLDLMYLTAVWKMFWRLKNVSVELEVAAPMTGLNTCQVNTHPSRQQ